MKRLRTKVVASILAVLVMFCSLPISSVTAVTMPEGGIEVTFEANDSIDYWFSETGEAFEDLVGESYTEDEYGFSITKEDSNYKVSFSEDYTANSFLFGVDGVGGVTIKGVTSQYKATGQWDTIRYNNATGLYTFPISTAVKYKDSVSFIVKVETVAPTYTVTAPTAQAGYTFEVDSEYDDMISHDDGTFKFNITSAPGYKKPDVKVTTGGTLEANNQEVDLNTGTKFEYTIKDITKNVTISYTGGKQTYTVTLPKVTGYSVTSSNGGNTVEHGGYFDFYVTPQTGYKSIEVTDINATSGNVIQLSTNLYRLSGVTGNVTISLSENAGKQTYSITLPSGTGYSVSVDDGQDGITKNTKNVSYTSNYNGTFKFKVTLSAGYTDSPIVVLANGVEVTADSGEFGNNTKQYTISNITANQQITVSGVTKNNYDIDLVTDDTNPGYTLTTTYSTNQIPYNSTFRFTLTVKDGYTVNGTPTVTAKVNEGSVPVVTVTSRADSATVYDCTLVVTNSITGFEVSGIDTKTYKVKVKDDGNGFNVNTLNGDLDKIEHNSSYSFTIDVKSGYQLVSVSVGTTRADGSDPTDLSLLSLINGAYYVNNITSDKTIIVEVREVALTVTYVDPLNEENPETDVTYKVSGVYVGGEIDSSQKYGSVASDGTVTFPIDTPQNAYNDYYEFSGWYNSNAKIEELTRSLGNADSSLTLTAQWTPKWEEIFTLQWDPNANKNESGNLTVRYTPGKQNIVPALEGAQITKVGMYYAQNESALSSEKLEALKREFVDGGKIQEINSVRQVIASNDRSAVLYVYVTSYTDITAWTSFEQGFTNVNSNRCAVGWIELTLKDGSKQYIYTDIETIPANS
ncbi:MAG: hypothetical protein J1E56_04720 [Ruminococcus sp.]|nr:hypothetical protein [Ruminococcus sp.]